MQAWLVQTGWLAEQSLLELQAPELSSQVRPEQVSQAPQAGEHSEATQVRVVESQTPGEHCASLVQPLPASTIWQAPVERLHTSAPGHCTLAQGLVFGELPPQARASERTAAAAIRVEVIVREECDGMASVRNRSPSGRTLVCARHEGYDSPVRTVRLASLLLAAAAMACHRAPDRPAAQRESPAPLQPGETRFAVIGDFGTGGSDELEVARMVSAWSPSFIVTVGDNNHPDGNPADLESHVAAAYAAFIPGNHGGYGIGPAEPRFFPALGNHDWRTSDRLAAYRAFFATPGNGRYYDVTLDDGRVQLFSLDSDPHEPDGIGPASKQATWMAAEATKSAAMKPCLRLVAFHHPPYSSAVHGSTEAMRWPFPSLGVDAVLTGHDHTYERLEVQGIPYFVDGLGGAELYPFRSALPESRVRYNAAHGAMLVTVGPEATRFEAWSVTGEKIDSLRVPKKCPR